MTVCVTGATGFIGAHVAAALAAASKDGERVRVTVRDPGRLQALAGVEVESVRADVLDRRSIRRAIEGCDLLFHTAGRVASRPAREVWRINAVAPRIVVESAADVGVRRVVITSSVAALGPAPPDRPADERSTYPDRGVGLLYADAKHEGERAAFAAGERLGIEVVAVNPAYVLGASLNPALAGETSTRIVSNYLRGRLPAIVDAYTNIVDVEDVAAGHLLAARKGRPGERYVLGGQNLRWSDVIARVAKLSGRRHPLLVLPPEIAGLASFLRRIGISELPGTSLEGIRLMAPDWRYSSAKAKREIGYRPRSASETLARTVDWCLELIESGRLARGRLSSFALVAAGVAVGDRLQLLLPLKLAGRLAGRRMVL
jgi:dihydroflavonol-4-reductase